MDKRKFLILMWWLLIIAAIPWGVNVAQAGPGSRAWTDASATPSGGTFYTNSPAGVWSYTNSAGVVDPFALGSSNSGTPLAKFFDSLPGIGSANASTLGPNIFIPIATKIANPLYPSDDYYEIGLYDYIQQMHSNLPKSTKLRGYRDLAPTADGLNHYLGPLIIAQRNKPVRIKFENHLGVGTLGNLFLPVDTTYMGAGLGPDGAAWGNYSQNRADIHLHGGFTPWISDGTPHQWVTPIGDNQHYPKGLSFQNVPDMVGVGKTIPTPSLTDGMATYYYPNQQSARLMFYHDHAYGMTRLNVYAGEAAGYLLTDQFEEDLISGSNVTLINPTNLKVIPDLGGVYHYGIPLIIQDKTFVPQDIAVQDAKWTNPAWGAYGDLWFPHVYETNQWPTNPNLSGANDFGRWDYGPWFFPPMNPATLLGPLPSSPSSPLPVSGVPEAFMDTPVVNGVAYPYLQVEAKPYRFRILNACNDRNLNLQLYIADPKATGAGVGKEVAMLPAVPRPACTATSPAATPNVPSTCTCNASYAPFGCFPPTWPTDGRAGGVPDPQFAGPQMIQIGTEGGFLPKPVVIPNQPVGYEYNRRSIVVLNVSDKTLFMGPAERADVIIDFTGLAVGKKVLLYNDGPAPVPGFDPRLDYYTGDPDNTWQGGAPSTLPGFGPNTRTIMQFQVGSVTTPTSNNVMTVAGQAALAAAFAASQPVPIIPQMTYPAPYTAAADTYGTIQADSLTFTPVGSTTPITITAKQKAIQELFELNYGRMNATLGVELPLTNFLTQTTIPYGYIDPATEVIAPGETQIWKITHNGVDTHSIHFHLFNVQVINRVGWDGAIRPPDANELGWKETVRMHPLEDIFIAIRTEAPVLPFIIPNSIRPLDVTQPLGSTMGFTGVDINNNPITVTNQLTNFGWEYVWHCHILGHEENDMMRPLVFDINAQNEILWRNTSTGDNAIWFMDGVTTTGVAFPPPLANTSLKIVGKGDFNNDVKPDILWRDTSTGFNYVWFMDEATFIGWAELPPLPNTALQIVGVGDFNGDGKPDILWRDTSTGRNYVWFMNGTTFIGWAELPPLPDTAWTVAAVRDFNNDGKPDILWRNTNTGQNTVWYMSGVTFTGWADFPAEADQNWQIVGSGDFNNDVTPDLLWRNSSTGENRVWYMSGVTLTGTASLSTVPDTNWKIVGH